MNIPLIGLILSLVTTLFNGIIFILIKFNDLKHLEISVRELKQTIKESTYEVHGLAQRVAKMEGILFVFANKPKISNKKKR